MKVCPKCKSENFDQLDSYASYLTCRDCGAEFYLPVEYCKECEALTAQIEGMYTREDEALEVFKMHYEVKDETLAELVRGLFRALGNVEQQCRELEKELEAEIAKTPCPYCRGRGHVYDGYNKEVFCAKCKGKGRC